MQFLVTRRIVVWILAAGLVLAAFSTYAPQAGGKARVTVREGYVGQVNANGTAIGFSPERDARQFEGYSIVGAQWRNQGGPWHEWETVSCLAPLATDKHVRLGVVEVAPSGDAPGRPVVVWLECLS